MKLSHVFVTIVLIGVLSLVFRSRKQREIRVPENAVTIGQDMSKSKDKAKRAGDAGAARNRPIQAQKRFLLPRPAQVAPPSNTQKMPTENGYWQSHLNTNSAEIEKQNRAFIESAVAMIKTEKQGEAQIMELERCVVRGSRYREGKLAEAPADFPSDVGIQMELSCLRTAQAIAEKYPQLKKLFHEAVLNHASQAAKAKFNEKP